MSTHSPGPWKWDEPWHSTNVLRAADGGTIVTYDRAYLHDNSELDATDHANRALIAAAPDMLALLLDLEWAEGTATHGRGAGRCINPECFQTQAEGHLPDCRLDRLLRETQGTSEAPKKPGGTP